MQRIVIFLFLLMVVCVAPRNPASACSISMTPYNLTGAKSGEYIFIGKVEEIVGPFQQTNYRISSLQVEGPAYGLRVRIVDPIHLPTPNVVIAEVLPYHLNPDCSISTESSDFLRKVFPIGSEVRVVGEETSSLDILAIPKKSEVARIEVSMFNFGSVSRNDVRNDFRTSAQSIYDYRKFVSRAQGGLAYEVAESAFYQAQFELRKDLRRLEKSTSQNDRINVLKRLVYYPDPTHINFEAMVQRFVKDKTMAKKLTEQRPVWLKSK